MLFCLCAVCICPHAVYWKGHPLWLLCHWQSTCQAADLTLFECSVYMWWALTWQSDFSVRPVLSQTGSWEQQRRCLSHLWPCLITQQHVWCVHKHALGACLDQACLTHLLLVRLRCMSVSECDQGKCSPLYISLHVDKQGLCYQWDTTVRRVRRHGKELAE